VHWPALLMALGLPPPKHVLAHAHWTLGHRKMAKSTGNVVNPFFALKRYGCDTMRYYLAHDSALKDDADYSNERIYQQYEFLRGALGNLLYRVFPRRKLWSVAEAVEAGCAQRLPAGGYVDARMQQELGRVAHLVDGAMERLNISRAVRTIADCLSHVGPFFFFSQKSLLSPTHL
jgi:methionyl-tRNA synthetase